MERRLDLFWFWLKVFPNICSCYQRFCYQGAVPIPKIAGRWLAGSKVAKGSLHWDPEVPRTFSYSENPE